MVISREEGRKIKRDRVYKTLGKMSLGRVILGIALLVVVLLISGMFSGMFAARGNFGVAKALMIAPGWMEKYKPELKAYIDTGADIQSGSYDSAYEALVLLDAEALAEPKKEDYKAFCESLLEYYSAQPDSASADKVEMLTRLLSSLTN